MNMIYKKYVNELLAGTIFLAIVTITVCYGDFLVANNVAIRQWNWYNLLLILPVLPLLFLQEKASLPSIGTINQSKAGWISTFGVGMIFGLLDLIVVKLIMHPEPYLELPPFLQPFPYSLFLYSSGALDVELYYRMMPITIIFLINNLIFKGKYQNSLIIIVGIVTSLIEPIQQFPSGAWWFISYATLSGIAMNIWQFKSYMQYGFVAAWGVRLGHYLMWHILLGIYFQYFELP